jgi:transcriptional regulator with XRE-family HTH domain
MTTTNIASGRQLRAARTLAGLTQSQLSTEAGLQSARGQILGKPDAPPTCRSLHPGDALTKIPLSTQTDYQPRPISEDDGRKLAEQILSMFVKLMGGL